MPSLAGMPAEQIIESMMAFKKGTRPAIIMDRVSRGYTDDEIKTMAYFFTKQPLKQWDDTTLAESVAAQAAGSIGAPK
jgi:sulfide dehydrogenase cytochrome subunit